MNLPYNKIDLYFRQHKLARKVDKKGNKNRDEENKRQEVIEKNLTVNLLELILMKKL